MGILSTLERVFEHIDQNQDRYIAELFTLLRQPSVSARREGLKESADLVCDLMKRSGFAEPRILWGEDNPCPYGYMQGPEDRPTVLLYGHHDVQPPGNLSEWVTPPFEPTIRDGRIYARGSGDNKGQMSAHLFALQSLRVVLGEVPVSVKCIFDGQEESASPHLHKIVEQNREALAADLMVWADGPFHESGRPIIFCGVRWILKVEFRARGANRDLHSGNWGGIAPNPAMQLVQLLATLKGPDGRVKLKGFYDRVRPISPRERKALEAMPYDRQQLLDEVGLTEFDKPTDLLPYEKLMFHPTFNIAGFHSGYDGPGFSTKLPHEAVAKVDMRLAADQDPDEIFEQLQAHVREHAPGVEVTHLGKYYPHRTNMDDPYVGIVAGAVAQTWGMEPILYPSVGGSAPDSLFARYLGVPTMLIPYANNDESNHAPNENMRVDCFIRGIKTSAAILYHLAGLNR